MNCLYTQDDQLLISLERKITRFLTKEVKFKVTHSTHNLCFYTNIKDKINKFMKSDVPYQFCCPGCNSKYTNKTCIVEKIIHLTRTRRILVLSKKYRYY